MRAFFVLLCTLVALDSFSMRIIEQKPFVGVCRTEHVGRIKLEDRILVFDKYQELRETTIKKYKCTTKNLSNYIRAEECDDLPWTLLCPKYPGEVISIWCLQLAPMQLEDEEFFQYKQECLSIPYFMESATGLAVEAFIKRLRPVRHVEADRKKRNERNKATVERAPDFSVLEAFRDDDFQNVINMNNEWLAHHDDPEYDHGAPMYWFADLDNELEFELRRIEPILNKIANQWIPTENRKKARQVLYDWREYFSGDYTGYS